MSSSPNDKTKLPNLDLRAVEFPSDAVSIKRLRRLFPEMFDAGGNNLEPYSPFFYPLGHAERPHLVRLSELNTYERVLAVATFFQGLGESLDKSDLDLLDRAKEIVQDNYLFFKLADSPEAARLLIQQVEDQGREHASKAKSRFR